jgi:C1A family cysteine protease
MKKGTVSGLLISGALTLFFLLLFQSAPSYARELDEIKAAIHKHGARWSAEETSVSGLQSHERKNRAALIKPVLTGAEPVLVVTASQLATLSGTVTVDWNAQAYVTPVKDQGNCGSCWAFATTGALESFVLMSKTTAPMNLSEQVLISCSGAGSCGGGYIDRASNFIDVTGLPEETCYPYIAANGSCAKACYNWKASAYGTGPWSWVATTAPKVDAIKAALTSYGPLVTTMDVYADFFSYKSGVYTYVSGAYQGGHAILIVGYTDDSTIPGGGYFKVKNSWGIGWGEGGFFRIAYSQLTNVVHFGYYTIAYHKPCTFTVSPTAQRFSTTGGAGAVAVDASDATCAWTAKSNNTWITIKSGSKGAGDGNVTYSVSSRNTSSKPRTGTITVAGQTFTVNQ